MTKFFGYAFLSMAVIWLVVSLVKLIADIVAKNKSKKHLDDVASCTVQKSDVDSVSNAEDK